MKISYTDFFDNTLADKSVDLIITDPPFKAFDKQLGGDELNVDTMTVEFMRLLRKNGQMIIFCNFKLLADIIVSFRKLSVPLQHLIVWDKRKAYSVLCNSSIFNKDIINKHQKIIRMLDR